MEFSEYQNKAMSTAVYKDPMYPFYGLVEEVGELSRLYAKRSRGDKAYLYIAEKEEKELGDILWMLNALIVERGFTLEGIAKSNLEKLSSRAERGTLKGDGDNR